MNPDNAIVLCGQLLTKELRQSRNGSEYAIIALSIPRGYAKKPIDKPRCSVWDSEHVGTVKHANIGDTIYVEASAHTRDWSAPDGKERTITDLFVLELKNRGTEQKAEQTPF